MPESEVRFPVATQNEPAFLSLHTVHPSLHLKFIFKVFFNAWLTRLIAAAQQLVPYVRRLV